MRHVFTLLGSAALITSLFANPALAAPDDRMARPSGASAKARPQTRPAPSGGYTRPAGGNTRPTGGDTRPAGTTTRPTGTNNRPNSKYPPNSNYRPNNNYRPNGGNNTIVTGNTVVVPGNNNKRYPVYRPPNGGYYRPPNGGYYRPPPPPPGGWGGGYYPPPGYYYDDGPSVGDVIAGVAVTGTLLYVLSEATKPKQTTTVVQGGPPPMPPPPQPYVPPKNSTGAPARINVDLGGLTPEARPTASVCLTEAARQIGATGGTEIKVDRIVDVQPGNGGYRFRLNLIGVYPDETRMIPMYCRATPDKIVELTFG